MKQVVLVLLAVALLLANAVAVQADTYEPDEPSKNILIDKMVGEPRDVDDAVDYHYVDNLGSDDHLFSPSDYVWFKLRVKNTSNTMLEDVVVKDYAPAYFTLDEDSTINAGDFEAGEEKIYYIRGRIHGSDDAPKGTTCVTNKARAEADGVSDEDTAQFCFTQPGGETKGVTTIPSTGPEDSLLVAWIATLLGYFGLKLRKAS